jgi:AhpD family alkylhydroperoxidase
MYTPESTETIPTIDGRAEIYDSVSQSNQSKQGEANMSESVKEFYDQYKKGMGELQRKLPDTLKGFGGCFAAIMKDGVLTLKQKELIALAIGVAVRCEPCINLHVQKCLDAGASEEEILEAASVAVMMQGGPSFTYLPKVLDALKVCSS